MSRIFLNNDAKFYQADKQQNPSDAEIMNPPDAYFKCLTKKPITRAELDQLIREQLVKEHNNETG